MSRSFWFAAGAGAAVYTMVRARRAAEILTADGLGDRINAVRLGARLVREEIAQGKAEAETDLRRRLGVAPPGTPLELTARATHDEPEPLGPGGQEGTN